MITFDVLTLLPQLFTSHLENLPFRKAAEKNVAKYNLWDLRKYSLDKYGTVDDKTYGGGVGMVLMVEPIYKALVDIYQGADKLPRQIDAKPTSLNSQEKRKVVVLSPRGRIFTQDVAREFLNCDQLTLICGRYEGIDARVEENFATDVVSLGNFVLSGGELAALCVMESITRLLPGVLEKPEASAIESFSQAGGTDTIEYPQYTRPEDFMGLKVPEILLSGNHKVIERWRKENSRKVTS